jgi:hypothetical protein
VKLRHMPTHNTNNGVNGVKAEEDCKKENLKFGYHNHDYEFEKDKDQVLYDVLLKGTYPSLVNMELDLG